MCVYLLAKLEVSSIILTSVRRGVILPPQPQNKHLKTQPRLGLREFQILGKHSLVSSLPSIVIFNVKNEKCLSKVYNKGTTKYIRIY